MASELSPHFVPGASIDTRRACGRRFSDNVPGNAKADGQFLPRRLVVGLLLLKQPDHTNLTDQLQLQNVSLCHLVEHKYFLYPQKEKRARTLSVPARFNLGETLLFISAFLSSLL